MKNNSRTVKKRKSAKIDFKNLGIKILIMTGCILFNIMILNFGIKYYIAYILIYLVFIIVITL